MNSRPLFVEKAREWLTDDPSAYYRYVFIYNHRIPRMSNGCIDPLTLGIRMMPATDWCITEMGYDGPWKQEMLAISIDDDAQAFAFKLRWC